VTPFGGGAQSFYGGAALTSNDLLAVQASTNALGLSVFVPIGLLIQPHRIVSLALRSGYRFIFWRVFGAGGTVEEHLVPIAFDLTFNVARRVDLGFTATILGLVSANRYALPPGTDFFISMWGPWRGIQRYDFFAAARF
jgi:hypothetical protein